MVLFDKHGRVTNSWSPTAAMITIAAIFSSGMIGDAFKAHLRMGKANASPGWGGDSGNDYPVGFIVDGQRRGCFESWLGG